MPFSIASISAKFICWTSFSGRSQQASSTTDSCLSNATPFARELRSTHTYLGGWIFSLMDGFGMEIFSFTELRIMLIGWSPGTFVKTFSMPAQLKTSSTTIIATSIVKLMVLI